MIANTLTRLARMDRKELWWRVAAASRIAVDRVATAIAPPTWDRRDLVPDGRFDEAHQALSRQIATNAQRFVIGAAAKRTVAETIHREFPHAERQAAMRADRVLFGHYDLLGYRGLRFDDSGRFEWNYDPVHDRRAPHVFWASVPYLDPAIGDHKIIWEFNRHQHWMTLGRAYWLTGDRKYRDRFVAELTSWLDANPPLWGINWSSMLELALRSLSWVWALHCFVDPDANDATPWTVDLLLALDRQLAHVEHNASYYFSPNTHLTGEALALYVAGRAVPMLSGSARYEAVGRRILVDEAERQIAGDGGHVERSAHYHRYTLDFYTLALTIARITHDPVAPVFERAVGKLAFAARILADDRGRLPHLGDDDGGAMWWALTGRRTDDIRDSLATVAALLERPDLQIGPTPEETYWLLAHPVFQSPNQPAIRIPQSALPSTALADTGYYVSRSEEGTHLVIDGGPHGYQNGGHAHADALAVTLSVRGLPLLIDPGAGCYTIDPDLRDRMRSSALHNTVTVDDRSQSIPRGPFHWAHTANAHVTRWRTNDGFDYFDGSHDGYAPIVHRRHLVTLHRDLIVIADLIDGPGPHRAASHWHLDPRWSVDLRGNRAVLTASTERIGFFSTTGTMDVFCGDSGSGLGWYSPAYGRVDPTRSIRVSGEGTGPFWLTTVIDLNKENPVVDVDTVPVWAEAGALAHGTALRIAREASTDYLLIAEPGPKGPGLRDDEPDDRRAGPFGPAASTWRVAEFETDARMLFCRTYHERRVTRVAFVDGSLVRSSGRRGLHLVLPSVVPDLHLDLSGANAEARIAGPAFGARLLVGGRETSVTPERRAAPRT
ncbi:MAG TPA: alginate lyase family protein [Vicinamibacterales bacterium]|nr:alginate lyase family protein [Vicinamibacterales bacterium]